MEPLAIVISWVSPVIAWLGLATAIASAWYKQTTLRNQAKAIKLQKEAIEAQDRMLSVLITENARLAGFVVAHGGKVKAAEIVDGREQKFTLN